MEGRKARRTEQGHDAHADPRSQPADDVAPGGLADPQKAALVEALLVLDLGATKSQMQRHRTNDTPGEAPV